MPSNLRRLCAEVSHVLHFGHDTLMELDIDELLEWHDEAVAIVDALYAAP